MDHEAAAKNDPSNVPTTRLAGDQTGAHNAPTKHGRTLHPLEGLAAGVVVAVVIDFFIAATSPIFHVPETVHIGMNPPPAAILAHRQATDQVLRNHAMLYVGSLGLLLGLVLGAQEGIYRLVWITPMATAALGALGGVLGGFLGCLVYEYVRAEVGQAELIHTIAAQWLLGAPMGLGIGLGLGMATRNTAGILKAALGGVVAATLAAALYPVIVSIALPNASTDVLVPEEFSTRLLWLSLLAGLIGLVIPLAGRHR